MSLPYPGYSWSMTHHVSPAAEPVALYQLLSAAMELGREEGYRDAITERIVAQELLTANVRGERPQAWRDYQQILPELGLIVSTKRFSDRGDAPDTVAVTQVGVMYLDGSVGHSELIATQCLRYQYPNGHKIGVAPAVKKLLQETKMPIPATRVALDANAGVLIKPAVLLLRVLLALHELGAQRQTVSVSECLAGLVPTLRNDQWREALQRVLAMRVGSEPSSTQDRRPIQEWYRLLAFSELFETSSRNGEIGLTELARSRVRELEELCDYHEQSDTFWIPDLRLSRGETADSWFAWYGGAPDVEGQWMKPTDELALDYVEQNYPAGTDDSEDADEYGADWESRIALQELLDTTGEGAGQGGVVSPLDAEAQARAQMRRERQSRLHERIVGLVAGRLTAKGYDVQRGGTSVDLMCKRAGSESIVEVKTVTARSLRNRLRLGVGQLSEYRYRWQRQTGQRPHGVLVLSAGARFREWVVDYLREDAELGLLSVDSSTSFRAYTQGEIEGVLTT